jgi:hypothetical protein
LGTDYKQFLNKRKHLIYINDLPKVVNDKAIPLLFADDTSILVKGYNLKDFQNNMINALIAYINGLE